MTHWKPEMGPVKGSRSRSSIRKAIRFRVSEVHSLIGLGARFPVLLTHGFFSGGEDSRVSRWRKGTFTTEDTEIHRDPRREAKVKRVCLCVLFVLRGESIPF